MASSSKASTWTKGLLGAVGIGAVVGLGIYLLSGRREKNSPFIPDFIEDGIDRVIASLDRRFGKQWVDMGLDVIERFLTAQLPATLASYAKVVFDAELMGRREGWSGRRKLEFVVEAMR
ncbi:MAG: hypothetical protein R3F65_09315 [bacterium]|nr:hypothetical protein [Myxococcales bacterium]